MKYGGADGELGASLRYLSQKFTMVTPEAKATLNDIATEEYICCIYQLFHSYSRIRK
jgi:Mn-containing catalase